MTRLTRFAQDVRDGNVEKILTQYSDILLAFFITSIVAMMLVPLPTPLLDLLLTTNIFAATTILFVSLYIQDATKIASFPTILLITTLFRLGLNVSSTRLILLQADAGEVIRAFGSFVAGGNLVVGLVIFLILTIIQFVVITKGAERVAEVAARFTLDALPGKQMSIDADFRAGLFDLREARRRRNELQRESQLYGAMDGAMKFVKGDAIAGIIIAVINLIGGFAIGVLQRGMDPGQAVRTYSLLTIGDGLVSQIPALLISVAAGIVVTRVASEEKETHLGQEIGSQILAQPKAFAIVSVLLIALGIVPGLPTIPFFILGAIAGTVSYAIFRTRRMAQETVDPWERGDRLSRPQIGPAIPILVQLSNTLAEGIHRRAERDTLTRRVQELPSSLYEGTGVLVPEIVVRTSEQLGDDSFAILLGEVPVYRGTVPADRRLVEKSHSHPALLRLDAEPAIHPVTREPAAWIAADQSARAEEAGLEVVTTPDLLALHLAAFCRLYLHEFVGLQEVRTMLDQLSKTHPSLVAEVVPKLVDLFQLTDVMQRLVREGVSIRDLESVLEALAEWGRIETNPLELTELVRSSLARQICFPLAGEDGTLLVHTVDGEIQQAIRESIRHTETGSYLGLPPDMREEILEATRIALGRHPAAKAPVLLVEPDVRPHLKKLLEPEFPLITVLSMRELTPELIPQPAGIITVIGERILIDR